jgi:hypothetical protein
MENEQYHFKRLEYDNLEAANKRIRDLEGWIGSIMVGQGKVKRGVYIALLLTSIPVAGRLFQLAGRRTLLWYEKNILKPE